MSFVSGTFTPTLSTAVAFRVSCSPGSPVPLSLVLAWTDPAGSVVSKMQLVNDLDLIVLADDVQLFGNMRSFADQLNTVERVMLPVCPVSGNVTAVVSLGTALKSATQTWYLVSNGPVTEVSPTALPPNIYSGRADPPDTTSESCIFHPGSIATVRFRPSAAWRCVWACNSEIATFTASLAQIVGVSGQAIRVINHDTNGISVSLQCSAFINAWQSDSVALKYVTPAALITAIQRICRGAAALCGTDPSLAAFDWSTFASIQRPAANTFISLLFSSSGDCSNVTDSYGEAPNPFNFTDQACFPGHFVMQPSRMQLFYKAVSCVVGTAVFDVYTQDSTCSSTSQGGGIRYFVPTSSCNSVGSGVFRAVTCVNLSPAVPSSASSACNHGSLCLPISDSLFYTIVVIASAHVVQFIAWVCFAMKRHRFSVSSALILLFVPVVGLIVWKPFCCTRGTSESKRHLLNVLDYVEPTVSAGKSNKSNA
jgi:hypothetical protein